MTVNTFLVTRPNYDITTRYISAWAKDVIDWAISKNHRVLDLEKERANRKEVESVIKKQKPSFVFLNGHGNGDVVTGQDHEPLFVAGENDRVLSGAIVYALSCQSAKVLGPSAVNVGATAYLGYKEDFVFVWSSDYRMRPREDKTADLFLGPSNQIPRSLLKGHTAGEAQHNAKKLFFSNVQKLLTRNSSQGDTSAVRYLLWNMNNLVCCGNSSARL